MHLRSTWLLGACLLGVLGCSAERPTADVRRPADPPAAVLVRGVSVLDVESGAVLPGRDVLLRDGRIAGIGVTGSLEAPTGAREISGEGATLLPGLVDMHGHVDGDPAPTWARGFPDVEANLRSYVYSGVTTVFDPHDTTDDAYARRQRIASGELMGPRIYTTGPLITIAEGHPVALVREFAPWFIEWYIAPRVAVAVDSEAAAEAAVDEIAANGADAIKIVIDAIPLDAPLMPPEVATATVRRASSHGLRTVAHIGTTRDAIIAAEAGVAAWVHGVYKEPIPESEITRLVGYGIPMVATVEVFDRYARSLAPRESTRLEREVAPAALLDSFYPVPDDFELGNLAGWIELMQEHRGVGVENTRRLHRAGMQILAGSDAQSGVFPGPGLHRELHHLVAAGLSPIEAIRAATSDPARWLAQGEEPEFGSIAPGKRADLLLVEGDPSRDVGVLERIREVFIAGVPLERTPVTAAAGS